jgi:uncharacterized damage-inducible protein DinB
MRSFLAFVFAFSLGAQAPPDGLGRGYEGELRHVSRQLVQLAEAVPATKYTWRPAPGIMSIGEVYAHVANANYFFLRELGITAPKDFRGAELLKKADDKAEVVKWLRASLDALGAERAKSTPESRARRVQFLNKQVDTTAEGVWMRAIAHLNEHMGQSIAYARTNGVKPPWSAKE